MTLDNGTPMQTEVAGAGDVRDEDTFDVGAVATWLREHADAGSELTGIPEVRQFTRGASNLTYLLRYADRDLILRRPPTGTKAKGAHDMRREHDIQQALAPVFPYVPTMIAMCDDESVIGSPFYVMERLEGTILRQEIPAELGLDEAAIRALCVAAIDRLVELHSIDVEAAGLAGLSKGAGYVQRQVTGWNERYRRAHTDDVDPLEDVMAWLVAHQPADVGQCVIHNDFRFDNMVLDVQPGAAPQIVGILDWELATVGDPLMDLGSALAYWVQADDEPIMQALRLQPTNAPGMLTRDEVVQRYAAAMGFAVTAEQWRFYEVFGLFRLAVIGQQIYYRFFHGQTSNPWFGGFVHLVRFLGERCQRIIAESD